MALNLVRNTRVFVSDRDLRIANGFTAQNTWEIPVQEGFSFSQGTDTQEITVNEAGAAPVRGSEMFNTALQPAEWSFSTYLRSYNSLAGIDADSEQIVDAILWHAIASNQVPDFDPASVNTIKGYTNDFQVDFLASNAHVLRELEIYFKVDNAWYVIDKVQVNQAEVDFSIDGIGMVNWSGQGTTLTEILSPSAGSTVPDADTPASAIDPINTLWSARATVGTHLDFPDTATYIKNKLSIIELTASSTNEEDADVVYTVPVTGGSLSIGNNVTYLTPETLSVVDQAIGSFTGARQINGSLTCYLNTGAGNSAALLKALVDTRSVKNSYNLVVKAGGDVAGQPQAVFTMPVCHLSVPSVESGDVIGLSIEFSAESASGVNGNDELSVSFTSSKV